MHPIDLSHVQDEPLDLSVRRDEPLDLSIHAMDWMLDALAPMSPDAFAAFGSPAVIDFDQEWDLPVAAPNFESEWRDLQAHVTGAPLWLPAEGAGPLVRQVGGAIDVQPVIEVVSQQRLADREAWNGNLIERSVAVKFRHNMNLITDIMTAAHSIDEAFDSILRPLIAQADDEDYIALSLEHEDLPDGVRVRYIRKHNFNSQCVLDSIYRYVQSNSAAFLLDGVLTMKVSTLSNLVGRGRLPAAKSVEEYFKPKKSIVPIESTSNACGWLALTLGKLMLDSPNLYSNDRSRWRALTRADSIHLWREMQSLFPNHRHPLTAADYERVQSRLPGYQLIVLQRPTLAAEVKSPLHPLFSGLLTSKKLVIELHQGHYSVVRSLEAYFGSKNGFCVPCWKPVSANHRCSSSCESCRMTPPCQDQNMLPCTKCQRLFRGASCLARHQCSKLFKTCDKCGVEHKASLRHECGVYECHHCGDKYRDSPHYCDLGPLDKAKLQEEDSRPKVIVCFDIEARLVPLGDQVYDHHANLLICHTLCDSCAPGLTEKTGDCEQCGTYRHVWFGDDCVSQFIDYVFGALAKRVEKATGGRIHIFSHNGKGYDHRFVMEELFRRDYMKMEPVMQGSKVLKIDIGNVRFQDSMAFLPMPLSQIPKAMGLPDSKGCFPHLFNREENYDLTDAPWPALEFFSPDSLKESARRDLLSWYETVKHQRFNFKEQLISYCETDVRILMSGVRRFRSLFLQVTGLDPTTRAFTLAGVAFEYFRATQLKANTIGVTPITGYVSSRNASASGNAWLDVKDRELGIKMQREARIGKYTADGRHGDTVFEFFGCYMHGCPTCFQPNDPIIGGRPACELYAATTDKVAYYESQGLRVVSVWECDQSVRDPYYTERQAFWKSVQGDSVRDALVGARTENFKLLHSCSENEEIKYVDVISLYPFVLKNRPFPIGHPETITEGVEYEPGKYFGLVKARVVPPPDLHIPVLPYRCDGKLLFSLCRSCAESRINTNCGHNDDERAIDGLFVSPELDLAVSKGYRVLSVSYVIHWPRQSNTLFAGYVNSWLKLKQEKSGMPDDVKTNDDVARYLHEYATKEGINLDPDAIEKNPGCRLIAKLMLNSLWGRLAMRDNMWQTSIVASHKEMISIVGDERKEVQPAVLPSVHCKSVLICWRWKDDIDARQSKTSPAIASFVTAYGRMHLFSLMDSIETERPGRVCYCDTDSVMYVQRADEATVAVGSLLGDLTDEAPDKRIRRGIWLAPKLYALEEEDADGRCKTQIKAKGLTLNHETQSVLTIDAMQAMALQYAAGTSLSLRVPQTAFGADKNTQRMRSRKTSKNVRVTSTKRRFVSLTDTHPHGWM